MKKSILIDSNIHQLLKMYVVKNNLVLSKFAEKVIKQAIEMAEIEEQRKESINRKRVQELLEKRKDERK